jgi:zinc transport system permease protein
MSGFWPSLLDPSLPFLRNALVAGLLSSILFGVLGSLLTVKRMVGLAGAISHAVLGGIGLALYLSATRLVPGFPPLAGALLFALLSAGIIGVVSLRARQRADTVINAVWAVGMSVGILFLAKTPGYADPSSYLFGNILLITRSDLFLLAGLDLLVLFLAIRFYPQLEASAFDEEFARTRGVPVEAVFLVLLSVTATSIVLLQTSVGIVMLIAMLALPAGTAGTFSKNLAGMMVLSSVFAAVFSTAGLWTGWSLDLPAGTMSVVIAGAVFLLVSAFQILFRRKS